MCHMQRKVRAWLRKIDSPHLPSTLRLFSPAPWLSSEYCGPLWLQVSDQMLHIWEWQKGGGYPGASGRPRTRPADGISARKNRPISALEPSGKLLLVCSPFIPGIAAADTHGSKAGRERGVPSWLCLYLTCLWHGSNFKQTSQDPCMRGELERPMWQYLFPEKKELEI